MTDPTPTTTQTVEQRLAALEARASTLEANADTAITKAGTFIATHAPTVFKVGVTLTAGYAASKFGVFTLLAKLL